MVRKGSKERGPELPSGLGGGAVQNEVPTVPWEGFETFVQELLAELKTTMISAHRQMRRQQEATIQALQNENHQLREDFADVAQAAVEGIPTDALPSFSKITKGTALLPSRSKSPKPRKTGLVQRGDKSGPMVGPVDPQRLLQVPRDLVGADSDPSSDDGRPSGAAKHRVARSSTAEQDMAEFLEVRDMRRSYSIQLPGVPGEMASSASPPKLELPTTKRQISVGSCSSDEARSHRSDKSRVSGEVLTLDPAAGVVAGLECPMVPSPTVSFRKSEISHSEDSGSSSSDFEEENAEHKFQLLDVWEHYRSKIGGRKNSFTSLVGKSNVGTLKDLDLDFAEDVEPTGFQRKLNLLVTDPSSIRHLFWQFAAMLLVTFDVFTVPLQIMDPPATTATDVMTWVARIFWTIDVPLSFFTGFDTNTGGIEMNARMIAKGYVGSIWFYLDVLLVCIDWAEGAMRGGFGNDVGKGDTSILGLLRMLRAIRLVRLVRVAKSQKITEFVFEHIRSEFVMLVAYIICIWLLLMALIHVIACLWYGIRSSDGFPGDVEGYSFAQKYFVSFHYALALFVGETLIEPKSISERVFAIGVLVFAFIVSAAVVGSLTTAMTRLQIIASQRSTQFAALNRFLADYSISRELQCRVQRNARHLLKEKTKHTQEENVELMSLISEPLRSEIHYEVIFPSLEQHPFFKLYNMVNPTGVRHVCHTAIDWLNLSRGDYIFMEREVPVKPRMLFAISGRLVYCRDLSTIGVSSGQWLSEATLWSNWAHRGTLRCASECRILAVDATRFGNIMATFPLKHGIAYAEKFVAGLNANHDYDSTSISDLGDAVATIKCLAIQVWTKIDQNFCVPMEWREDNRRRSSAMLGGRRMSDMVGVLQTQRRQAGRKRSVASSPAGVHSEGFTSNVLQRIRHSIASISPIRRGSMMSVLPGAR